MVTRLEDLPDELFLYMFSVYFDGVELYKLFYGINFRFNSLLKSLNKISLRLEDSSDDQCLNIYSKNVISLYIGSKHRSIRFVQYLNNVRSIKLVDPTIIQIINLLDISHSIESISIIWSNPYSINLLSARAFYELIYSASASSTLRKCRFYLPESHSLYIEAKHVSLAMLTSLYVQITNPMSDFRRLIHMCPNLKRFEIEIIDTDESNEELRIIYHSYEHLNILRFHLYNLLSIDLLEIYIEHLPNVEYLYISMKFPYHPMDFLQQLSKIINRIKHLKQFSYHFSTDFWNLGQQQLDQIKQINLFFQKIHVKSQDDEFVFTNQ